MKLEYYYSVTSEGYNSKKIISPSAGKWKDIVRDERQIWLEHKINDDSLAMTFVREGVVFVISHPLGGDRGDENVTTWLFFSAKIRISGKELLEAIDEIRSIYKKGTADVSESMFAESVVLNKEFEERKYPNNVKESPQNSDYAFRVFGDEATLMNILEHPFQEYYQGHRFIFLYKMNGIAGEELLNLSDKKIEDSICVLQPTPESIKAALGDGSISIHFENGEKFDSPKWMRRNQKFKLVAKKDKCDNLTTEVCATEDEKPIDINSFMNIWRRRINASDFIVVNKKGTPIGDKTIKIKNRSYDKAAKTIPEKDLKNVEVEIVSEGYDTSISTVDLQTSPVRIILEKVLETVAYKIRTEYGQDTTIKLIGVDVKKSDTPIKGYRKEGDYLVFEEQKTSSQYPKRNSDSNSQKTGVHQKKDTQKSCSDGGQERKLQSKRPNFFRRIHWGSLCCGCILGALLLFSGYLLYNQIIKSDSPLRQPPYKEVGWRDNTDTSFTPIDSI